MIDIKGKIRNITKYTKNENAYGVGVYKCITCDKEIHVADNKLEKHTGCCFGCSRKLNEKISKLKTRVCKICNIESDIRQFASRNGKHSKCSCYKCGNLKKYGLNHRTYLELLKSQNSCCAICQKKETILHDSSKNLVRLLAVDHDHNTGKVRGLLCGKCNKALGMFEDSVKILDSAIKYLRRDG